MGSSWLIAESARVIQADLSVLSEGILAGDSIANSVQYNLRDKPLFYLLKIPKP